ncbi:hypothetical protein QTP70_028866 [Hemibagrus guttatus]|uniref:Eukaryotic translation initiation factor 4E type 2 n=1 Tax=Hemibagrus guttatus TaxID=175788 RepID=A0AAE0UNG4_9TELE|nr:hypothetical protein QTP70_028866 [Hemibagrus guttatus]
MNNKFDALKDDDSGDHDQDNNSPKDGEKERNEDEEKDQNTTKRKAVVPGAGEHPLQYNYTFWYSRRTPGRPASTQSYEQNIKQIGSFASVEQFWRFYSHMIRPGDLTGHSDFHLFKEGIKPMWEDDANKSGGKWIIRLRKGLASRCWENLILAMLGEQFMVGEEICGAVVSVRFQEDIISIWNKTASDQATTARIRDTLRRVLNLPPNTIMEYKTHTDSIKAWEDFHGLVNASAEVIRETGRKVLGVSSGRRKEDKETWWWNEEVQDSVQRKRLAKKKWDMDRTEENRQEYKELQRRVKREVSKAKQKAYEELYTRLDTREGEKDLYRLARQRDRDGKDVQQVRVIKDRDGRVLTSEESVQRRWKEYFEELMNEENEREKRVEGVNSVEQKVDKIRKDEVRKALKRMKSGKAVGPDDIPVEVWKCLGEAAVEFLANLFNRVLESERMPEEWRRSVLVPIFKNKGDVQSCSNYRGIKLMSHTMKLWERVVEARLRKVVEICEQQYGFMPRKSTTDAIFALRILMEKYRDGQKELHCVFVDLEKAYDRVPREELWYCMRKSGVAEKYVRVVQDMYERSRTVVRCAVGQTEKFNVEVGLHQGSALSPFLFAIVMDQLSEEVRQESPWTMMFADDIVICSESREQVEENLERWRFALERRGMKVSRSKTEYMCVNEREGSGTVRLQGEEVKKVQEFKYLGSTVQSNGECGKEENISKNQGEGVQDSGETGHAVWFRDSVNEEETGVRARGSRAEDVEVLFGSDKIGQD